MNAQPRFLLFLRRLVSVASACRRGIGVLLLAHFTSLPCDGGSRLLTSPAGFRVADGATAPASALSLDQISASAEKQYNGDGLFVRPTAGGAQFRCVFQGLEGEITREGLWLRSTTGESKGECFRVVATAVKRAPGEVSTLFTFGPSTDWQIGGLPGLENGPVFEGMLPSFGRVEVAGDTASFIREGLTEEYRVSVNGVRQDFLIARRFGGEGQLQLDLDVRGAKVEPLVNGARLVLDGSGRKLNYSRLRVTDATGRELAARMEVGSAQSLAVMVDDTAAIYPIRIDPTFSDADWFGYGGTPGPDDSVLASAVDTSGNLYVGGDFTTVADVIANGIAKWNGSAWSSLGSGMRRGSVYALVVSGTNLYAGGYFTNAGGISANHIARWNGSAWSALGSGMDAEVESLAISGTNLYAGGFFNKAGSINARHIARWNGSAWSALGSGINGHVYAISASGNTVYAGGYFSTAGNLPANHIARWNGSAWSALGSGLRGDELWVKVQVLLLSGNFLYVGGNFTNVGGINTRNIARWSGSAWSVLGSGLRGEEPYDSVNALAVSGSDIYAGGNFTNGGGVSVTGLAKWNGSAWSAVSSELSDGRGYAYLNALSVLDGNLYVGGLSITVGGVANRLVKWDGSAWSALGSGTGFNDHVSAIAISGSDLYAGGYFTMVGGSPAQYIAKWDAAKGWSALGSGLDSAPSALAISGSDLYAGGYFTNAGGVSANQIAKWNGTAWSALGSGTDGSVYALAVSGTNLYAGGYFNKAGGISANQIAKWNGSAWSALGSAMNDVYGYVNALAVSGDDLYAGGYFTNLGGISANCIAKWNGSAWSALGSGMRGEFYESVDALAVLGNDLYAGGDFTSAGGVSSRNIAKWNGNTWSALGSGMDDQVRALAVSGSDLYVGGWFNTAGGISIDSLAKWNSETGWSALGSGVDSSVNALAVSGSDLFAGGYFTLAGGKISTFFARASIGDVSLPILSTLRSGANITFSWPSPGSAGFLLEQSPSVTGPSWTTNSISVIDNTTNKSVMIPITQSAQFFRLRKL